MPYTAFVCPDWNEHPIEACLQECRLKGALAAGRCLSVRSLKAIANQRKWNGVPSTTQLLRGTRESYLCLTEEYSIDPLDMVYALFGTKVHDLLDQYTPENGSSEIRLYDDISSGAYDFYQDGVLYDDKTYGSYAVAKTLGLYCVEVPDGFYKTNSKDGRFKKGDPKFKKVYQEGGVKHRFDLNVQMNDYRMKLEKEGFPVKMMVCEMLVRDGGTYVAKNRGVNQKACLAVINKISDKWIHLYMKTKWGQLKHALETKTLPPVCKPRERWYDAKTGKSNKCANYCQVRNKCNFGIREMSMGGNNSEI
jgi:hypothetical protein